MPHDRQGEVVIIWRIDKVGRYLLYTTQRNTTQHEKTTPIHYSSTELNKYGIHLHCYICVCNYICLEYIWVWIRVGDWYVMTVAGAGVCMCLDYRCTRVPLLISHPASRFHGRHFASPVESVDIFPTVLDLLGGYCWWRETERQRDRETERVVRGKE